MVKIKIEKAWINIKCFECGKLIYPNKVYKVKPEKGRNTMFVEWRLCELCFKKIFSELKKKSK